MASIRERAPKGAKPTYSVLYRETVGGKTRQRSETFGTRKAAERFRSLVDIIGPSRALAELSGEQNDQITVDELAERFMAWKAGDVTARTMTDYRRDYDKWLRPRLGCRRASSINEVDIQEAVDSMSAAGLAAKSVGDKHMLLHSMFRFGAAKTRRLVDYNPCTETSLPKRGKRVLKGATLAEWKVLQVAALAVDPDAADLMTFIAATGWRWSEAAALAVRHVDDWEDEGERAQMRATVAQVFRKDGQYRQKMAEGEAKSQAGLRAVRVPPSAAAVVRRRVVGLGPDDLVFTNAAGRKWYQQNFLSRTWKAIEEKAALDRHLTPHAIRHLHVALLDRAGASPSQMQRRLGHEDITTTLNVYGGMIDDVDHRVLDALDRLLHLGPHSAGPVVAGEVLDQDRRELIVQPRPLGG